MKRILFSLVALVGLGFAASPAMAHGHHVRRVCVPSCTPVISTCLPTVTSGTPAPAITQPCAPVVTNCAPACAPVPYYHAYRTSHFGGWSHVRYSRRCR
jgi:hypothetical protein